MRIIQLQPIANTDYCILLSKNNTLFINRVAMCAHNHKKQLVATSHLSSDLFKSNQQDVGKAPQLASYGNQEIKSLEVFYHLNC